MQEYIARLVEVFAEVKRILTDDGTLWVNIADSYAGSMKGSAGYPQHAKGTKEAGRKGLLGQKSITSGSGITLTPKRSKSLLLIVRLIDLHRTLNINQDPNERKGLILGL